MRKSRFLSSDVMMPTLILAIGLGLAYFSGRLVSNRVYAIRASDPLILTVAVLLIVAITFLATTIPAARAARLSPADVLQSE